MPAYLTNPDAAKRMSRNFGVAWKHPSGWFPHWPAAAWIREQYRKHAVFPDDAGSSMDPETLYNIEKLIRRWSPVVLKSIEDEEERAGEEASLAVAVRDLQLFRIALTAGGAHAGS